jgi:transcription initiation factor TFIIB
MRVSHRDAQTRTDDTQTCEECGGQLLDDGTETVCDDCGLVADEDAIDRGAEWRCDDTGERARAGTAVDRTRHDNGFSTRIGFERSSASSETHRRLLRAKRLSKHEWSTRKPRDQAKCLSDIKAVADRLELPQSVSDNACVLFQEFHNETSHHGHSLDAAVAACVYASARIEHVGIAVETVAEQLSITERRLFLTLDRLREEIDVAIPIASPRMYVARYVNDLDGEARTETVAREVAAAADEAGLTANGAAPSAVAAGCVYEAFVAAQWEAKRSQPDVGDVAGVSDYTVRRHWHRIQEAGIDGGQVDV